MSPTRLLVVVFGFLLLTQCSTGSFASDTSAVFSVLASLNPRVLSEAPPSEGVYIIRSQNWSNCDSSLPVQASEWHLSVLSNNLIVRTKRFHTAVLLMSSVAYNNVTIVVNGSVYHADVVYDVAKDQVAHLDHFPFRPNSSIVLVTLLPALWVDQISIRQTTQFYSQDLQVVGCVHSGYEQVRVERTQIRQD